jgi:hypothetical protein
MPLTRLKEQYLEQDGVRFLMADESGNTGVRDRRDGSEISRFGKARIACAPPWVSFLPSPSRRLTLREA